MAKSKTKSFFDLTPAERQREVSKFDRPLDLRKTKPLSKKQQMLHDLTAGKKGPNVLVVEIDPKLVAKAAELAKERGITLNRLMELGVKGIIASSGH